METNIKIQKGRMTPRKWAVVTTMLFFVSLSALLYLQNRNWDLSDLLKESRLQQETLIGETGT